VKYDAGNIFARILRREVPANVVFEDDRCMAFRDASPQAPTHVLIVPKSPIARLAEAKAEDEALLGHLVWAAAEVARRLGVAEDGFRVVINNGVRAGQSVYHLHLHVLGGRDLLWPPG
jgi:histidine triad (HIT) family protein